MSELYNPQLEALAEKERDARVAQQLREKGFNDPEARQVLIAWLQEVECQADAFTDPQSRINVDRRKANLFYRAGEVGEAIDMLEQAYDTARWSRLTDLAEEIRAEIDLLKTPR